MQAITIQACLNGGRTRAEHPAVPLTPEEVAADARRVVRAGASALHLHPRDATGKETLDAAACAAVLAAVRSSCPGIPISFTTSLAVEPDPARRLALVRAWHATPDVVSVNLHEDGALDLCQVLIGKGVAIEAGLWTLDAAELLVRAGIARHCARILVEALETEPAAAVGAARAISRRVYAGGIRCPQLHHGEGPATWAVVQAALRDGQDIRIGLEDTLVGPDGAPVSGNAELVRLAVALVAASRCS